MEEENEKSDQEYNENKNMSKKRKSARQTEWYKIILKQINECQLKLFGKEQPKREYNLNDQAQEIIVKHYEDKNPNLKKLLKVIRSLSLI